MIVSNKAIQRIAQLLSTPRRDQAAEVSPSDVKAKVDEVTLSPQGRELQALQRRLAEADDVRSERVKALREAIEKGEYHVPAEKIAERMIEQNRLND